MLGLVSRDHRGNINRGAQASLFILFLASSSVNSVAIILAFIVWRTTLIVCGQD